jgi:DNA (cytosine-5)-methyltransferase 1
VDPENAEPRAPSSEPGPLASGVASHLLCGYIPTLSFTSCFSFSWNSTLLKKRLQTAIGRRKYLSNAVIFESDICTVDPKMLLGALPRGMKEVDLISGGPPCQPFSRAGKRETLNDDRGGLFAEFARIVGAIKPKAFLFENVKGLIQSKADIWFAKCSVCADETFPAFSVDRTPLKKSDATPPCKACKSDKTQWVVQEKMPGGSGKVIRAEFERLGYHCHEALLEAADFGVPQYRQRWLLVGFRDDLEFRFPEATHVGGENPDLFSQGKPRHLTLAEAILRDEFNYHGVSTESGKAVLWVKNVVRPHDEPVTWALDRPSPAIGAHQGAKLAIAPKGVPPEQLFRQQWHTRGRRQGDTPPVDVKHAYLTDHDLLRLQTFPDDWFVFGTRMERALQIGNAVPPKLGEVVGRAIIHAIQSNRARPQSASRSASREERPSLMV